MKINFSNDTQRKIKSHIEFVVNKLMQKYRIFSEEPWYKNIRKIVYENLNDAVLEYDSTSGDDFPTYLINYNISIINENLKQQILNDEIFFIS